jgi:hypothetical protein
MTKPWDTTSEHLLRELAPQVLLSSVVRLMTRSPPLVTYPHASQGAFAEPWVQNRLVP